MREYTISTLENVREDGLATVLTEVFLERNSESTLLKAEREQINPVQLGRAKELLSENLFRCYESLCTAEVVDSWNAEMSKLQGQK